ncbi:MAG: hypothetical protein KAR20_16065, partial [Candidatus Heimdallarchaeota archaeon]|nr:hypothetical protein [Candidatus Heimdallarchaeota archaeon]
PLSLTKLRRKSLRWMAIYLSVGLVIFALFIWLMLANQIALKELLMDYFFPQSWHEISEQLINFMFESQAKTVISNLILSGSLVMASLFLFPVKEKYSAEFEKEAGYSQGSNEEFSLLFQAWEETKLFLIYLTAQSLILLIGYYPFQWSTWLSIGLSYLFLFFTFGLDFISPTLQRHKTRYSLIIKILTRKLTLTLTFGLLFSLPVVLLSQLIFTFTELTLVEIASIIFSANIFFLTLAVPAGTRIASSLQAVVIRTPKPQKKSVVLGYSIMFLLLLSTLFLHAKLIASMHHKSQLLKAEYQIDWDSFDYVLPSLSQFVNGKALTNLSFNIMIINPTEFDIVIEKSQIYVQQKENVIAKIDLNGFEIPADENRKIAIILDSDSDMSKLSQFNNILKNWHIEMEINVWPGLPFVINLMEQ